MDNAKELLESILERYDPSMSTMTASLFLDEIIKELEDFLEEN